MDISLPLIDLIILLIGSICNKSISSLLLVLNIISPETILPGLSIKRIIDNAVTDFPQPLSPTTPRVLFFFILKAISSIAGKTPSSR